MSLQDDILTILENNRGQAVSGQEIADQLQVTRAAVWKGIKALQNQGCAISAATHKGYLLAEHSDMITSPGIIKLLGEEGADNNLIILDSTDSTNTQAKALALGGAPHKSIVIAREQKAGRGRQGRAFFSSRDKGIYMSLILRPSGTLTQAQLFTIAAAVAVCRAIENLTPAKPEIKWVNDIFCQGKKVGGILTEAMGDFESNSVEAIILGIGLNLAIGPEDFPPELSPIATSLFPQGVTKNQLIAAILTEFYHYSANLTSPQLLAAYKERSLVLGRTINYPDKGGQRQGRAVDINQQGNLIVQTDQGLVTLYGGEISLRSSSLL